MRSRWVTILALAGILWMSACSSSEEPTKVKATSNTNSTNTNTVAVNTGTTVDMPQVADANVNTAHPATSDEQLAASKLDQRIEGMRKSGESGVQADATEVAMKNARPAPDNSTFTSFLTDAGYEIRTFKNHPQLLKVEKKITPDGKQAVKVFLRDGKVVELPGQKIPVLATIPAAQILEAAGIRPPAPPAPAGPPPTKKSGE